MEAIPENTELTLEAIEFQLALKQRKINDLLNEVEFLRRRGDPSDHIPPSINRLIESTRREERQNTEEISLLREVTSSTNYPEAQQALRGKLRAIIERNKALGDQLGIENLQRLHAQRALLRREHELLRDTEEELRQHKDAILDDISKCRTITKRCIDKFGQLEHQENGRTSRTSEH